VAQRLGLRERDYINKSYGELFLEWKADKHSDAHNMTFAEISR